jgi:hypothetical protein
MFLIDLNNKRHPNPNPWNIVSGLNIPTITHNQEDLTHQYKSDCMLSTWYEIEVGGGYEMLVHIAIQAKVCLNVNPASSPQAPPEPDQQLG